ncbi:hypothetical protein MTO96_051191 [Rhipicephalus appendiculatus]
MNEVSIRKTQRDALGDLAPGSACTPASPGGLAWCFRGVLLVLKGKTPCHLTLYVVASGPSTVAQSHQSSTLRLCVFCLRHYTWLRCRKVNFVITTSELASTTAKDIVFFFYGSSEEYDVCGSVENPYNHIIFDPLASDDEGAHAVPKAVDEVQHHVKLGANTDWGAKYITRHPGFEPIYLNIHALQVAYYTLMEDRPSFVDTPKIHTKYRYTAYRKFVWSIWVWLGWRNRMVLQSGLVNEIRNAFPAEHSAGFNYPESPFNDCSASD